MEKNNRSKTLQLKSVYHHYLGISVVSTTVICWLSVRLTSQMAEAYFGLPAVPHEEWWHPNSGMTSPLDDLERNWPTL